MKRFFFLFLLVLVAHALAASPVGEWQGKLVIDRTKMPKVNAEQKKAMDKQFATMEKIRFSFSFKAGGAYTSRATFVPGTPDQTAGGSWTQNGSVVAVTVKTLNGKPAPKGVDMTQKMTLSADGKTLTLVPVNSRGTRMVLKRK